MRAFSMVMALQLLFAEMGHHGSHVHASPDQTGPKHASAAAHLGHNQHGKPQQQQPANSGKEGKQVSNNTCLDNCCASPGAIASAFFTARHILIVAVQRVAAFASHSVQLATLVAYLQPPAHAPPLI
jgi:hypothetical protein